MRMNNVNEVHIQGFLGQDPESRHTQSGMMVTTLSIATVRRVKKDDAWTDETSWHRVTVFGKENMIEYLAKGMLVRVTGRLHYRDYEKDGKKVYVTDIIADELGFCQVEKSSGNQGGKQPANRSRPQQKPAPKPQDDFGGSGDENFTGHWDDDVPF